MGATTKVEAANASLRAGLAQPHMPILDGIRAIAVFLVIFYHAIFKWVPGGLGVLMFFVISGFLITWLLLKEHRRSGDIRLGRFYARRSLRIFPAFYAYSALVLALLLSFHKHIEWPQTIAALLYVNNYYQAIHGDPGTGFSHTWSLGIEEQFYLLWPGLVVLLGAKKRPLMITATCIIVAVWVHRAILQIVFHVHQGYFYEALDTRLDHLMIGCLLAVALFTAVEHPLWSVLCDGMWKVGVTVALLVLSSVLEYQYSAPYRDSAGFIVNPLLTAVLIPQLIANRGQLLTGWLDWKPVRYLGRISYSLYLYQQLVLDPIERALQHYPQVVQAGVSLTVLLAMASGSYYLIEKPFLKIKDRQFASVPKPAEDVGR
jgi:peptidoglycan/LPS O-acetylase OafA/YrhL